MVAKDQLSKNTAHTLLKKWDCVAHSALSENDREAARQALMVLTDYSDYQILGVCAGSAEQGLEALISYANALRLPLPQAWPEPPQGAVYLKLNPKLGRCYIDSYSGDHRGVLVSYQSAYDDGINGMYGHLPLDLFA